MSEPATLEPLRYAQIEGSNPQTWRWALPESEKWRRDNPQSTWPKPAPKEREAEPLPHLIAKLEARTELGAPLESLLREVYAIAPEKVSQTVSRLCDEADRNTIRSPGGLLYHRLMNLRKR